MPNVTVRRARRADPLEVLKRTGTINARESEAGEKGASCNRAVATVTAERLAVRDARCTVETRDDNGGTTEGCLCVRCALAVPDNVVAPAVLWIVLGDDQGLRGIRSYAPYDTS